MYLAAQRVQTASGGGLNSFLYHHGVRADWNQRVPATIPDRDPGQLAVCNASMVGPGRVLSYIDVVAPDGTPVKQFPWIHDALVAVCNLGSTVLPLTVSSGVLMARFFVSSELVSTWHPELHCLLDAAFSLLPS